MEELPELRRLAESTRFITLQFRQLLQTVQVVAPELIHTCFQSPYPFSFFWQVLNRFLVACHRRLFRISETRKLDVGNTAVTSGTLQHAAFIRESLFAFACPSAVLTGELENFPIRIPSIQLLLPDSRFWWTLSRSAPWSQCSTHPLTSTHSSTPPSFGKVFSPLPVHPQCSQVNWRIFQSEYHRYSFFCPTVGSGGRSLDLHLGLSVLLIPLPPLSSSPRMYSRLKPSHCDQ